MALFPTPARGGSALRSLFEAGRIVAAPGCFDALSARILEAAGFSAGFLGGFSVAATRLGLPDAGLLSYGEMLDQARDVCAATSLPILGDGDTGYGNPVNAERTLLGFARAGLACVMIEDQRWPKRCGHMAGKEVVDREEAVARIRACVRAREEHALDVWILARTDALATDGLEEALWRASAFADLGADITFLEAPTDVAQMRRYCQGVPGIKTANLVEDGKTPWLPVSQLEDLGYGLVLYPVSLVLRSVEAMRRAAEELRGGASAATPRVAFDEIQRLVGFPDYRARSER